MKPISVPAVRRASPSRLFVVAVMLAVVALVAPLGASPAQAGWAPETAIAGAVNTRPALAMDSIGHLGVAWQHSGDTSGIHFATDASGAWVTSAVSAGDDWSPDLVFDGAGSAHVAYLRFGTGAGLYHATNASGRWVSTLLRADPEPWSPSVAIDAKGKLHIAYASEGFTPGVYHYTNASGVWAGSRVTTSTWDSEPSIAVDGAGTVLIAFARYDPASPGIYVRSRTAGSTSWTESRASSGPMIDDYPSVGVDPEGHLHVAYLRYDAEWNGSLWYATNVSGAWARSAVSMPGTVEPSIPSLGFDGSGAPEIVAGVFGDDAIDSLYRFSGPALGAVEALIPPGEHASDFPDALRDASGRLTVAYRDSWHAPGVNLHREEPDEDVVIAASVYLWSPAIQGRDDVRYLVIDRYGPEGLDGTTLAHRDAGAWTSSTLDPGEHGAPDVRVAGSAGGTALYVTNPRRLMWDEGGAWQGLDFAQPGDEASLAVGFDPLSAGTSAMAAYTTSSGIRLLDHGVESQLTADGRDRSPDLGTDVDGARQVLAFVRDEDLYAIGTTGSVTIDLISDASWIVDDADAAVGPPLSLPAPAQRVCLNDGAPIGCPADATRYGFGGTGWSADLSSIPGAAWIWAPGITGTSQPSDGDAYTFTKTVNVPGTPSAGSISVAADDAAEVRVNGQLAGQASGQYALSTFDIGSFLVLGTNTIAVTGVNAVACGYACSYAENPGGVVIGGAITYTAMASSPGSRKQWSAPQLIDGSSAWNPASAISEHSGAFIAYDRHSTNPGIYVARGSTSSATWALTRLSRSWADSQPAIVAGPPMSSDPLVVDSVYVAWVRQCYGAAPGVYVARNGAGWTWTVARVVASCDVSEVSIDVVNGKVVLAYREGGSAVKTMTETSTTGDGTTAIGPGSIGRSTRPIDTSGWPSIRLLSSATGWLPVDQLSAESDTTRHPAGSGHVPAAP